MFQAVASWKMGSAIMGFNFQTSILPEKGGYALGEMRDNNNSRLPEYYGFDFFLRN